MAHDLHQFHVIITLFKLFEWRVFNSNEKDVYKFVCFFLVILILLFHNPEYNRTPQIACGRLDLLPSCRYRRGSKQLAANTPLLGAAHVHAQTSGSSLTRDPLNLILFFSLSHIITLAESGLLIASLLLIQIRLFKEIGHYNLR